MSRHSWMNLNQTLKNNKAICDELKNNPQLQRQLADYAFLMERAVTKGEVSADKAAQIFKTDMKNLNTTIENKFNQNSSSALNDQTDLTNPRNMELALQNPNSYASQMMDQLSGAITESIIEAQENIISDIQRLFEEEEAETNQQHQEEKNEEKKEHNDEEDFAEETFAQTSKSETISNESNQSTSDENTSENNEESTSSIEKGEKIAECIAGCLGAGEMLKDDKIKDTFEKITGKDMSAHHDNQEEHTKSNAPTLTPPKPKKND